MIKHIGTFNRALDISVNMTEVQIFVFTSNDCYINVVKNITVKPEINIL